MSKKRIFKKGLVILTVLTMVISIAVNVSAATTAQHFTTTEYTVDNSKVTVTSTITGVTTGEQVTYLAYDQDRGTETTVDGKYVPVGGVSRNIIYIDQQPVTLPDADGKGKCIFNYTADINSIGSVLIKFGAETTPATDISPITTGGDMLNPFGITTAVNDASFGSVVVSEYSLSQQECTFKITPVATKKIDSITRDDGVEVPLSYIITGQDGASYTATGIAKAFKLTVNFAEDTEAATRSNSVSPGAQFAQHTQLDALTLDNLKQATTFSKVTVASNVTESQIEYGILFSYYINPKFTDNTATIWSGNNVAGSIDPTGRTGVKKYKALGKGADGAYAVILRNGESGYLSGKFYTTPYMVIDGEFLASDKVFYGSSKEYTAVDSVQ